MYKLINPVLINHRAEEWGGKEMVIDIIKMLKIEYDEKIVLIENAIKTRDFKGIKELVHPIKSNFYFFVDRESEFGAKIQELENKGKFVDETNLDQLFSYFKTSSQITLDELDEFIKDF